MPSKPWRHKYPNAVTQASEADAVVVDAWMVVSCQNGVSACAVEIRFRVSRELFTSAKVWASRDSQSAQHRAYGAASIGIIDFLPYESEVWIITPHEVAVGIIKEEMKVSAHKDVWREFFILRDLKKVDADAALQSHDPDFDRQVMERLAKLARNECESKLRELGLRPAGPPTKPGEPVEEEFRRKRKK